MTLRPYQQEAVDAIKEALKMGLHPICELPTGAGKSHVISTISEWITSYKGYRVLITAHRKELVKQNARKITKPVSIYSAGLKSRDTKEDIIVGGIQSIYNKDLGKLDAIIVDECHMVSQNETSMYQQLFANYPDAKRVGLTATPYRTDAEKLETFDFICYQADTHDLIKQGYLCNLKSKVSKVKPTLDHIPIHMGDYIKDKLAEAMLDPELLRNSIEQILAYGKDRRQWLIFCVNVAHANIVAEMLRNNGITAVAITGETDKEERDESISLFQFGDIQAITNCDVLTTGFDAPEIDMITMLRPTQSKSLYVQMVGRGLRIHENKEDCLILDFAGNINTHGPITNLYPQKPSSGKRKKEEAEGWTHKVCPECESVVDIELDNCPECDYEFKQQRGISHNKNPSDIDILGTPQQWFPVRDVFYSLHKKVSKPNSLKVTYQYETGSSILEVSEWICVEHTGPAKRRANTWFRKRLPLSRFPIDTVSEAIALEHDIKKPTEIKIVPDGKYQRVTGYKFGD